MTMTRLRTLPDGRFVERDNSGNLFIVLPNGGGVKVLQRNSEVYAALGLRSDLDDRALYNHMDPSTLMDPGVLVWDGSLQKYIPRSEAMASSDPTGIGIGPHEPPLRVPSTPSEQQAPATTPPTSLAAVADKQQAPAPEVPRPTAPLPELRNVPISAVRPGLLQRIREWLRRVFG
jgi:hypothetical protein